MTKKKATEKKATKRKSAKKKTASKKAAKRTAVNRKSKYTDEERRDLFAELAMKPAFLSGLTGGLFAQSYLTKAAPGFSDFDGLDYAAQLRKRVDRVNGGDMSEVEGMLVAQATALNAMFNELTRQAGERLGNYFETAEILMKLAFRAQSQSRMTLQTLGEIKNPRSVAFVRANQANLTTGNQQVNNGQQSGQPSRARENETEQNKLLETKDGQRLDPRAPGAAGAIDPQMETVGTVHGPADG